jgi:hypothetical protein
VTYIEGRKFAGHHVQAQVTSKDPWRNATLLKASSPAMNQEVTAQLVAAKAQQLALQQQYQQISLSKDDTHHSALLFINVLLLLLHVHHLLLLALHIPIACAGKGECVNSQTRICICESLRMEPACLRWLA